MNDALEVGTKPRLKLSSYSIPSSNIVDRIYYI